MSEYALSRISPSPTRKLADSIRAVVATVPPSTERTAADPEQRARVLTLHASTKSAMVSGSLAMPPGPLGMLTVLPDLLVIWRIQRQLVADIAAAYGKTARLGRAEMLFCLFRHAAGQAVREVVVRAGERYLVRRATLKLMQRVMRRVGVEVSERAAGRAAARWIPLFGAVGIGGFAFYDTSQVGHTAIGFFESEIVDDESPEPS